MPYIEASVIERIKRIDLLTYLQEREPDELVRIAPAAFCTKSHDSLKISNGKWYWWSRGIGGKSALDYLIKVRGMSFLEAVRHLNDKGIAPMLAPSKPSRPKTTRLQLPPPSGNDAARRYLASRGISLPIIDECIQNKLVYGSAPKGYANVVFVGRDAQDKPRYAAVRGCKADFKGEAAGSDKRHAFKLLADEPNPDVHVFECAIDVLSYATILERQGRPWQEENLISLGGVAPASQHSSKSSVPAALLAYLEANPNTADAFLHLDNDKAGLNAAAHISAALSSRLTIHIEPPPTGKDVNDHLLNLLDSKDPPNTSRELPKKARER